MPTPAQTGRSVDGPGPLDHPGRPRRRGVLALAGDPHPGDRVEEPRDRAAIARHPLGRAWTGRPAARSRRRRVGGVRPRRRAPRAGGRARSPPATPAATSERRRTGGGRPGTPGCSRSSRRPGPRASAPASSSSSRGDGGPALEGGQPGRLDHRAVHHRVRERDAHLDRVGAGGRHRLEHHHPVLGPCPAIT